MIARVSQQVVEDLWASAQAAARIRAANMPTEQRALNAMFDAWYRLKELGWKESMYAPKDQSRFQAIEPGSTGIFICWRDEDGHFWLYDGDDVYPSSPVLYRPILFTPPGAGSE